MQKNWWQQSHEDNKRTRKKRTKKQETAMYESIYKAGYKMDTPNGVGINNAKHKMWSQLQDLTKRKKKTGERKRSELAEYIDTLDNVVYSNFLQALIFQGFQESASEKSAKKT